MTDDILDIYLIQKDGAAGDRNEFLEFCEAEQQKENLIESQKIQI